MRLSGARPNRTWNMVVSSSTAASMHEGDGERAVEGVRLVVDLLGVAGDRDQKAAVVAEIDGALDQPQPLVLRPLHIAAAGAVGAGRDAVIGEMRQPAVPQRARGAHLRLGARRAASPASTSPTAAARTAARRATAVARSLASSGVATSATSVRR